MSILIKNAAKCRLCGDVIESKSVHDFVSCSCGEIFVDGGLDYLRRGFTKDANNFIDRCEYEDENPSHVATWQYYSKYHEEWRDAKSTDSKAGLKGYEFRDKPGGA
jgi:hypothetical protein